jgi:GNAT superfamily N-acetyltransferase
MNILLLLLTLNIFTKIFSIEKENQEIHYESEITQLSDYLDYYLLAKKQGIDILPQFYISPQNQLNEFILLTEKEKEKMKQEDQLSLYVSIDKLLQKKTEDTLLTNKNYVKNIQDLIFSNRFLLNFLWANVPENASGEEADIIIFKKTSSYISNLDDEKQSLLLALYSLQKTEKINLNNKNIIFKHFTEEPFIGNNRNFINVHNLYILTEEGSEKLIGFLRMVEYIPVDQNNEEMIVDSLLEHNKNSYQTPRFSEKKPFGYIALFIINEKYRDQKYARLLLEKAEKNLMDRGILEIILDTNVLRNPTIKTIYEELGFVIISNLKHPLIQMHKLL